MTDSSRLHHLKIDRDSSPKGNLLPWVSGGLVLLLVLVGVGYAVFLRPSAQTVEVETVQESGSSASSGSTILNASGYVTARRMATVSSKTTGKIVEVLIEEGMKVKDGQILARLDAKNTEANRDLAMAQWESAKASVQEFEALLKEAEIHLDRIQSLARERISSTSELDRAQAETDSLKARLQRTHKEALVAERQVEVWNRQLEDLIIRAPFEGVVVSKDAQPGEMVSPVSAGGGFTRTGICTIVDMNSLEIEVDVNESYINRVQAGQPVKANLDSYPDWDVPAKVIAIIPTADRQKATVQVRIGFDELDERILPDMGVKVAFQESAAVTESRPAKRITVPEKALFSQGDQSYVWVVNRDNRLDRRAVSIGDVGGGRVAVLAGLRLGERIVKNPLDEFNDGDEVNVN